MVDPLSLNEDSGQLVMDVWVGCSVNSVDCYFKLNAVGLMTKPRNYSNFIVDENLLVYRCCRIITHI